MRDDSAHPMGNTGGRPPSRRRILAGSTIPMMRSPRSASPTMARYALENVQRQEDVRKEATLGSRKIGMVAGSMAKFKLQSKNFKVTIK